MEDIPVAGRIAAVDGALGQGATVVHSTGVLPIVGECAHQPQGGGAVSLDEELDRGNDLVTSLAQGCGGCLVRARAGVGRLGKLEDVERLISIHVPSIGRSQIPPLKVSHAAGSASR